VIPRAHVVAWRAEAPWPLDSQVERDLALSRAIIDMFGDPDVSSGVAMGGGTALHKILLRPAQRYSEDIDLVQTLPGPIGVAQLLAVLGGEDVRAPDGSRGAGGRQGAAPGRGYDDLKTIEVVYGSPRQALDVNQDLACQSCLQLGGRPPPSA
jgi:hypothetical protein